MIDQSDCPVLSNEQITHVPVGVIDQVVPKAKLGHLLIPCDSVGSGELLLQPFFFSHFRRYPELQRSTFTVNGSLNGSGNHSESDQLVQLVCGNLGAPAVLKLQLDATVELLRGHRPFIDDLEDTKLRCALELQCGLPGERNALRNVCHPHDLRLREQCFNLLALDDLCRALPCQDCDAEKRTSRHHPFENRYSVHAESP